MITNLLNSTHSSTGGQIRWALSRSSTNLIRVVKSTRIRLAWHVACMGERRNAYRILVGKPEGKRLLGRPKRRWEDNIKLDLQEV